MSLGPVAARVRSARMARLATSDPQGRPHVVPVCFAWDGEAFYTAVDRKPKRAPPERLARVRNLRANPSVALLVDYYDDDWSRLWYTLVRGRGEVLLGGEQHAAALGLLRDKYPQYQSRDVLPEDAPVIRIVPTEIVSWGKPEEEE